MSTAISISPNEVAFYSLQNKMKVLSIWPIFLLLKIQLKRFAGFLEEVSELLNFEKSEPVSG